MSEGLLDTSQLERLPSFPKEFVDFGSVIRWKEQLLRSSLQRFRAFRTGALRDDFEAFRDDRFRKRWLEDWALFSALKERFDRISWTGWPEEIRRREPTAIAAARERLAEEIDYHRYVQFLFSRHWGAVKTEANRRGIRVLGDVPFYVALDSSDVWANGQLFDVDEDGTPRTLAGVPPDYFSEMGQLWGNPLYRWDRLQEVGYAWWVERIRENLRHADVLRLDHFRGFASFWEVPAGETTAMKGSWRPGPGKALFDAIRAELGEVPFVAEDLGFITPDVGGLLGDLELPGMKVLQFAFGDAESDHLPGRFAPHNIVYTGTHDNDTTRGWFADLDEPTRERVVQFTGGHADEIHWDLIAAAYRSDAELAIVPLQDVLGLGSEARTNDPARSEGNWRWRVRADQLRGDLAARLRTLAEHTGREADLDLELHTNER